MLCKEDILIIWGVFLLIYAFIFNVIPRNVVMMLKKYSKYLNEEDKENGEFTLWLGTIEIFSFALSIVLGVATFIGVWLGIKTLNRWRVKDKNESPKDASAINIFLIGNLLSVLMGVFGGLLFKLLSNSWGISDILNIN